MIQVKTVTKLCSRRWRNSAKTTICHCDPSCISSSFQWFFGASQLNVHSPLKSHSISRQSSISFQFPNPAPILCCLWHMLVGRIGLDVFLPAYKILFTRWTTAKGPLTESRTRRGRSSTSYPPPFGWPPFLLASLPACLNCGRITTAAAAGPGVPLITVSFCSQNTRTGNSWTFWEHGNIFQTPLRIWNHTRAESRWMNRGCCCCCYC